MARTGRTDGAYNLLMNEVIASPQNPKVLSAMGNVLWMKGDIPGAVEYYEKSLIYAPGDKTTMTNLQTLKGQIAPSQ